jgi:hypothetical protein
MSLKQWNAQNAAAKILVLWSRISKHRYMSVMFVAVGLKLLKKNKELTPGFKKI